MSALQLLTNGLQTLGLALPTEPVMAYLDLLYKWNRVYNLTAIRCIEDMVSRHVLDSLAILPWVHGTRWLDVGSGAGLPGIPLALARPDAQVVLMDSNGKKVRFLREVKRTLALDNVEIVQARALDYHPTGRYDTVMSRALSDIATLLHWTRHLCAPDGLWLAMKGHTPETELALIQEPYLIKTLEVPGVDEERSCVIIRNTSWQK